MREPLKTGRGRGTPCCSKVGLKTGQWTSEEDDLLASYVRREGEGKWRTMPKRAGLLRCGKSCRLRWMNYLRPSVKRGQIAPDEEDLILRLHRLLGNRWSLIAGRIPGRTDNEIKNYWNTHLSKKLLKQGIDPRTHMPLLNPTCSNQTASAAPSARQEAVAVKEEDTPQQVMSKDIGDDDLDVNFSDDMLSGFLDSLVVDVDVFLRQDLTNNNPTETLVSSLPPFEHDEFWEQVVHPSAITLDVNGDVDDHFGRHSDSQI